MNAPTTQPEHLPGREEVVDALRRELLGPDPHGAALSITPPPHFTEKAASYGPWVEVETGEEILQRDRPTKRYGIGVLYPRTSESFDVTLDAEADETIDTDDTIDMTELIAEIAPAQSQTPPGRRRGGEADDDDFDLSAAMAYRPSAMAVSLLVHLDKGSQIRIDASGARYERFRVIVGESERDWWVRRPVSMSATISADEVLADPSPHRISASWQSTSDLANLDLVIEGVSRPSDTHQALVTIAIVNRTESTGPPDQDSLFQTSFTVRAVPDADDASTMARILPYPDEQSESILEEDPEARSIRLLYRKAPTFAVGHGCAATWGANWGEITTDSVCADPLPSVETPSITPDITLVTPDGGFTKLEVPMAPLAGLEPGDDGMEACLQVVAEYRAWIDEEARAARSLTGIDRTAASEHLDACERTLERIRNGIAWLSSDPIARRSFELANRAVLYQQIRSGNMRPTIRAKNGGFDIEGSPPGLAWRDVENRGKWRPFQIGFLLASMKSTILGEDPDRETVDLIFFPTGGGKTEAYLGLAAFSLFYQRLARPDQVGVGVLMRYTLRLLTAQQFLRASALICAMEHVRKAEELGGEPFSIGIWVGQSATPIRRDRARSALRSLHKDPKGQNPFLLLRCPWCNAQMGPVGAEPGTPRQHSRIAGYAERNRTVQFHCPDRRCEFKGRLPIYVIDEDVYEQRPSIIIGTVDKFAMLAWRPDARSIFGIDPGGDRALDPPNLIIQDELHLISGPLGSMVGHYETLIESLCTDDREQPPRKPKIVSSTATIRRYSEQVKGLYARDRVDLFPPHGLDASDSFFARYATDPQTGKRLPGRMYLGVHAPGLGSIQTAQVRTMATLLQAGSDLEETLQDPWWTLMVFFNSLRELGTSVSLLQSDIPDYLVAMKNRRGIDWNKIRRLNHVKELTSRLRQDEIPQAIDDLERVSSSRYPVDVCVASNIIEVGIDISRLALMCVVGQPKSTSQYIQVTGRVGRLWEERPGLIVTIYGASKPRDRSHFEQFQSYHDRLYAQVEPVSVTPFAPPVVERAAHAVLSGYVRQRGPIDIAPWPMPVNLLEEAVQILTERAATVDAEELGDLKQLIDRRIEEWQLWTRSEWAARISSDTIPAPLLRRYGQWLPPAIERQTWLTPTSMRDVDAECQAGITTLYSTPGGQQ